jgi:hypothetical protein
MRALRWEALHHRWGRSVERRLCGAGQSHQDAPRLELGNLILGDERALGCGLFPDPEVLRRPHGPHGPLVSFVEKIKARLIFLSCLMMVFNCLGLPLSDCATPFTIQCPLSESPVESQNWYLVIASPSASLTLNSDDARGLVPCATLIGSVAVTTGARFFAATTWNSCHALQPVPSLSEASDAYWGRHARITPLGQPAFNQIVAAL